MVLGLCAVDLVQALGLLLFAIALSPEINVAGIPIRIEDLIIPVLIIFALIRMGSQRTSLKPTKMKIPIFFFLFFMLVSTLNAIIVDPGIPQLQAAFHFLKHVEYIFIFLLALNVVEDAEDVQFLSYCVIAAAIAPTLMTIYSPFGLIEGAAVGQASQAGRLHGVATETANIFGGYLAFHILFALGIMIEKDSVNQKLLLLGATLLMAYPLMFTMSRSSYTGLVAGLAFLGLFKDPKILIVMFVAGLSMISIIPDDVIQRFLSIFQALSDASLTPSWQARLEAWRLYVPVIVKNPFIGQGLFFVTPGEVDNEYVLRGVETGVLGLMSFLWVFTSLGRRALALFESAVGTFRQVGVGYSAALVSLSVHALAAPSFTAIRTAEPLYFTSGLLIAAYLLELQVGRQHTNVDILQREENRAHQRAKPQLGPRKDAP